MKFTRSRNQVGPKEACMNEGGEGTEQDSSVAPMGTSSSPALESPSACVGPGHEMSGAPGWTLTAQPTSPAVGQEVLRTVREAPGAEWTWRPLGQEATVGAAPAAP